jgi:hypothetical protein
LGRLDHQHGKQHINTAGLDQHDHRFRWRHEPVASGNSGPGNSGAERSVGDPASQLEVIFRTVRPEGPRFGVMPERGSFILPYKKAGQTCPAFPVSSVEATHVTRSCSAMEPALQHCGGFRLIHENYCETT